MRRRRGGDRGARCDRKRQAQDAGVRRCRRERLEGRTFMRRHDPGLCGASRVKLDILSTLNAERSARRAVIVVTDVASGAQRIVKAADVARDPLKDVLEKHIRSGKSGMEETPQGKFFLTVHVPPARLVITGAVHISQALAPMAKQ